MQSTHPAWPHHHQGTRTHRRHAPGPLRSGTERSSLPLSHFLDPGFLARTQSGLLQSFQEYNKSEFVQNELHQWLELPKVVLQAHEEVCQCSVRELGEGKHVCCTYAL